MPHHWIPNSSPEVKNEMLKALGIKDVMELFNDIPDELILKRNLDVGFGRLTEYEAKRKFLEIAGRSKVFTDPPPFIGGGVCAHYVPSVIKAILSRSEFYSAYTPYQPEIAQGLLQAFFEYQSLMAELYGVDIVNASMYNGSTAAAEAVRMALRVKRGRSKVLIAASAHPEVKEVIRTWLLGTSASIFEVPYNEGDGEVDLERLKELMSNDVAALYIENPNFFGVVETHLKSAIEIAHDNGSLAIVNANPISLGIFEAPGKLGADIVVGDAQPLGLGMNYGGPSAGIFGIMDRKELVRQLPGRLIGATKTVKGDEIGYMMILQTREQHIRRERATSNITTNSGLEAIAAAAYVSLLGSEGLRRLGEAILGRTYYTLERLPSIAGISPLFTSATYFREIPIATPAAGDEIVKSLLKEGIHIGPPLGMFFNRYRNSCLICVTELHTKKDIDRLISSLQEVVNGA